MKIITYARVKDFFDKEFFIEEPVKTIQELREMLQQKMPAATMVLSECRFAVNDEFVEDDFLPGKEDTVHIIPPSSGG